MRIVFLLLVSVLLFTSEKVSANAQQTTKSHFKIIFGSCLHQDKPQPIWQSIETEQADLLVLLGDNIYGDTKNMAVLEAKYKKQWLNPGMQKVLVKTPILGIWDDHDYGENDAGAEYPQKEASRQIMLDYFNEPKDSLRRTREDGIYTSYFVEYADVKVQIILPDLRWNRSALKSVSREEYLTHKAPQKLGPYLANVGESASMLGKEQWQWLEEELQKPADLRILGSSLQLLPEFSGWESWANFPNERQQLLTLLDTYNIDNLVIVSGDTHWSEFSKITQKNGKTLWDMTTSGLTEEWKSVSPNKHRVGQSYSKANYGVIELSGQQLLMSIKDVSGTTVMSQSIDL
jgi:alkaline phosphatase D